MAKTLEQLREQVLRMAGHAIQQEELGMTAREMETYGRRLVGLRFKGGSGRLRNSLVARLQGDSIALKSPLKYALIQDQGGTIHPKAGKYLTIPMGDGSFRRVKRVVLKGKHYLRDTLVWGENRLKERLEKRLVAVLYGQ